MKFGHVSTRLFLNFAIPFLLSKPWCRNFIFTKKIPFDAFRAARAVALPTLDLANVALADGSNIYKPPYNMPSHVTEKQVFTQEDRGKKKENLH